MPQKEKQKLKILDPFSTPKTFDKKGELELSLFDKIILYSLPWIIIILFIAVVIKIIIN